jgi:hypothetical protein
VAGLNETMLTKVTGQKLLRVRRLRGNPGGHRVVAGSGPLQGKKTGYCPEVAGHGTRIESFSTAGSPFLPYSVMLA